jgi:curved DNA-binding protein CbpA
MSSNFFELLQLEPVLQLDHNELKKNYFNLLKEYSTDPVLDPKGEKKTDKAKIDEIEQAYQTLKDRVSRIAHLLSVEGMISANDIPSVTKPANQESGQSSTVEGIYNLAREVAHLIEGSATQKTELTQLKQMHGRLMSEFSHASLTLTETEKKWDRHIQQHPDDTAEHSNLLTELRDRWKVFCTIRALEQDLRKVVGL